LAVETEKQGRNRKGKEVWESQEDKTLARLQKDSLVVLKQQRLPGTEGASKDTGTRVPLGETCVAQRTGQEVTSFPCP
jgi:hypothetical protein